jgi:hypothetical protein
MKYQVAGRLLVIAVTSVFCASSAFAVPYVWTADQIQGLVDVTPGFNSGQLSTINSITPIPNGIELNVTFKVGQNTDPFGPDFGQTFARVSLQGQLGFPGLDLSAFTSSSFDVTTTTDVTVQSFLQTDFMENGGSIDDGDAIPAEAFSFYFWEHNDGVATGGPTPADFDFAAGTEFGGWSLPSPQPVQGTNAIRAWGLQLGKFSGITFGQPITATIRIEGVIPEPATLSLIALAGLGMVGFARRRS